MNPDSPQNVERPVMLPPKEYLGDGVYVEVAQGMVRLTTENGVEATNEIFLEVPVLIRFLDYAKRLGFTTNSNNQQPE